MTDVLSERLGLGEALGDHARRPSSNTAIASFARDMLLSGGRHPRRIDRLLELSPVKRMVGKGEQCPLVLAPDQYLEQPFRHVDSAQHAPVWACTKI